MHSSPELSLAVLAGADPAALAESLGSLGPAPAGAPEGSPGAPLRAAAMEILLVAPGDGVAPAVAAMLPLLARRDPRIRLVQAPSALPATGRNAAIRAARAPLIGFLEPGDRWRPQHLRARLALHRRDPGLGASFCDWSEPGLPSGLAARPRFAARHAMRQEAFTLDSDALAQLFAEPVLRLSTLIARTRLLEEIGGFHETAGAAEAWELSLRLAQAAPIACLPRAAAILAPAAAAGARTRVGDRMGDSSAERLVAEGRVARLWHDAAVALDPAAAGAGAARLQAERPGRRPFRAAALRLQVGMVAGIMAGLLTMHRG